MNQRIGRLGSRYADSCPDFLNVDATFGPSVKKTSKIPANSRHTPTTDPATAMTTPTSQARRQVKSWSRVRTCRTTSAKSTRFTAYAVTSIPERSGFRDITNESPTNTKNAASPASTCTGIRRSAQPGSRRRSRSTSVPRNTRKMNTSGSANRTRIPPDAAVFRTGSSARITGTPRAGVLKLRHPRNSTVAAMTATSSSSGAVRK